MCNTSDSVYTHFSRISLRRTPLALYSFEGPIRAGDHRFMIVLEDVSKSFDSGRTYSVQSVNLRVPEGHLLVLLGGSGCGKTTTLKMINRLIEPTGGRILVNGQDVRQSDAVALRRG